VRSIYNWLQVAKIGAPQYIIRASESGHESRHRELVHSPRSNRADITVMICGCFPYLTSG
jgi:hypothetical protein